jgi:O-antigen ligase
MHQRPLPATVLTVTAAAYLVLTPLMPWHELHPHDLARIGQVFLLALGALALLSRGAASISIRVDCALALLGLSLASAMTAALPNVALQELALDVGLIAAVQAWAACCREWNPVDILKIPVLASCLYVSLQLLVFALAMANNAPPRSWLLAFGYDNPRFLNHVQTLVLPLLVCASSNAGLARAWRRAAWGAGALSMATLAATFGRGTALALLASGVLAAAFCGQPGRAYARRLVRIALAGLAIHLLLFLALPELLGLGSSFRAVLVTEGAGDHSRLLLWRIALDDIRAHPWLGIGPMHYAHYPNPTAAHPHNIYLQIAAELGLPAFALIAACVWRLMRRAWQGLRAMPAGPEAELALAAFVACLSALFDGVVSGNFVMPMSQMWIVFSAGLLAGSLPQARVATAPAPSLLRRGLMIVLLGSQLWLLGNALMQASSQPPRISAYSTELQQDDKHRPRFWLDGWF